jgi:hypothetical protein
MGRSFSKESPKMRPHPTLRDMKSDARTIEEVRAFVAKPAPPKRKCGRCPTLLRSGNKSNPPRCSICENKFPSSKREEE